MNNKETFTIIKDTFGKQGSNQEVEGLTLIIDGKLKEVFDTILCKTDRFEDYTSIMSEVVLNGINKIIDDLK